MANPAPAEPTPLPPALLTNARWTLGLLVVTMIAWLVGAPWAFAVLVTGPAAAGFGIAGLIAARGVDKASVVRVWLAVSVGIGVMAGFSSIGLIILNGPLSELEHCYERALTVQARAACDAEYQSSYEELLGRFGIRP